jgi:hypothetical protein
VCRYIKELADRINSIEGKLDIQGKIEFPWSAERESSHFGPPAFGTDTSATPAPPEDTNRKRPFSSISTTDFNTPTSARQVPWGSEPRPIKPMATPGERYHYSATNLTPQPLMIKPDTPSRPTVASMDSAVGDIPESETPREVDDATFDLYALILAARRAETNRI